MKKFKIQLIYLALILGITISFFGCSDDTIDLSRSAQITSFIIPNQAGNPNINQTNKTITVYLKPDASTTDITPSITVSKGATYTPKGTQNFTNPVAYTVTAEDGVTKQTYTVTAVVEKSSLAIISKFSLSNILGDIDNTNGTIQLILPVGSDITSLTPDVTVNTGATYTPKGTQNFTNPVIYTVTAEDGITQKKYTVTIVVEKSTEALITSFSIPNQEGETVIDSANKTIVVYMPVGSNVTNLIPSVAVSQGATYTPEGNQNFTNPVTYRVTSEDETVFSNYTVMAIVISDSNSTFISKWKTQAVNKLVVLPLIEGGTYACYVDWGDGTITWVDSFDSNGADHIYENSSFEYTISITGTIEGFSFGKTASTSSAEMFIDISQWGSLKLGDVGGYFSGCRLLEKFSATDVNLEGVTNLSYTFLYCVRFNGDISSWDVSQVTDMSNMFLETPFNQDISSWDVSQVTDMNHMFDNARVFNQDIGDWDVSQVTDMNHMFNSAWYFNQNIGAWDVSQVTDMNHMFSFTRTFNQDIGAWDVSQVTDMNYMFFDTRTFNQDLSDWCVTNTTHNNFYFLTSYWSWKLPKPQWGTCPNP